MRPFTLLFAMRPSFTTGLSRIFDFSGFVRSHHFHVDADADDNLALLADWHAVGEDLQLAFNTADRELRERGAYARRIESLTN